MPSNSPLLIVDDNAPTRYSMRRVLERHGYTVMEAGTGAEGLSLLAKESFAALILDVNLPDISGFDIVRHLRGQQDTRLLPVIHVSAASIETGDLITGLDAGADAYLIHPVDPDVLLATLRTLLRVRSAEDTRQDHGHCHAFLWERTLCATDLASLSLRALRRVHSQKKGFPITAAPNPASPSSPLAHPPTPATTAFLPAGGC